MVELVPYISHIEAANVGSVRAEGGLAKGSTGVTAEPPGGVVDCAGELSSNCWAEFVCDSSVRNVWILASCGTTQHS